MEPISNLENVSSINNSTCHPGSNYRDYYDGTLSLSQVTATYLKLGAQSSNELLSLDYMT